MDPMVAEIAALEDGRYKLSEGDSVLGTGGFGSVICVCDADNNDRETAVKRIHVSGDVRRILREIRMLRHFSSPCILQLYDLFLDVLTERFCKVYIMTEKMDTNLNWVLFSSENDLTLEHISHIGYQMALGLFHMHSCGCIHRDFKPANILLSADCDVKLCDFGASRSEAAQMSDYVTTRWYRAPEQISMLPYSSAIDVWGLGVVLAEMIIREPLFPLPSARVEGAVIPTLRGHQLVYILQKIGTPSQEDIDQVPHQNVRSFLSKTDYKDVLLEHIHKKAKVDVPQSLLELIRKMLEFNPSKRPTMEQVLRNPFFRDLFTEDKLHAQKGTPFHCDLTSMSQWTLRENILKEVLDLKYGHQHQQHQQDVSSGEEAGLTEEEATASEGTCNCSEAGSSDQDQMSTTSSTTRSRQPSIVSSSSIPETPNPSYPCNTSHSQWYEEEEGSTLAAEWDGDEDSCADYDYEELEQEHDDHY